MGPHAQKARIMLQLLILLLGLAADPAPALPPPKHGGVYVVAHRGVHDGIPENTLAAYSKAIEIGVDYVEIDLRETSDGHIVSVHNATVDAYTTDAKGPVKSFTLSELKAMDIGSRVAPEWKDERIPTFDEILTLCKDRVGIYLDLKDAPVPKLVEIIQAHGMQRQVLWYAGGAQIKQLQEICPDCIPMPDPGPEMLLGYTLKTYTPRVVAATWKNFSQEFVRKCHEAGAIVIVDEDTPACWEQAFEWRADGIQTDHPAALVELLKARAEKKP